MKSEEVEVLHDEMSEEEIASGQDSIDQNVDYYKNNVEFIEIEQIEDIKEDKIDDSTVPFHSMNVLTLEVKRLPRNPMKKSKETLAKSERCRKTPKACPKPEQKQKFAGLEEQRQKELCPDCGAFVNRLKEHMESHMGAKRPRRYECPHCDKKFFNKSLFDAHVNKHSNLKPFQCPECDKSFHGKGNLRMHMNTHSTVNKYACHGCEKTFRYSHHLAQHRRIHTKEMYVCQHCSYSNAFIQNYRNHMMTHNSEPRFKCEVCPRGFNRKSYYMNHMKSYHPLGV